MKVKDQLQRLLKRYNLEKVGKVIFLAIFYNSNLLAQCNDCTNASCIAASITDQITAFSQVDGYGANSGCTNTEVRAVTNGNTVTFCAEMTTPAVLEASYFSFMGSIPIADNGCDATNLSNWTLTNNCSPIVPTAFPTLPPNFPLESTRPVWPITENTTYEMCYDVSITGTCTFMSTPCFAPHWVQPPCNLFISTSSQDCSRNDGTYDLVIPFTNGGQGVGTYSLNYTGTGVLLGDDPNLVPNGSITISGITDGLGYDLKITGNGIISGCDLRIYSNSYTCSFCPKILSATVERDNCEGSTVTLSAIVDLGIEGENYYIEWFVNGNPINLLGSSTFGPDGIYGSPDDASALSYIHTLVLDGTTGVCAFEDQVFTAQLYCKSSSLFEQGNINNTTTGGGVANYNSLFESCINNDLSSLPPCAIAESFDYQYRVTSGPPFGQSWICEATSIIRTPVGPSGPFCHEFWNGVCPSLPAGSTIPGPNATTCWGGPGNDDGSALIPAAGYGNVNLGGVNSTTPVSGNWRVCIFDSYNDTNGATEGVINYVYLKVGYILPPGCSGDASINYTKVDAVNISTPFPMPSNPLTTADHPLGPDHVTGLRVCNSPTVGVDYSLPDFANCETSITTICSDAQTRYSNNNGVSYLLTSPPPAMTGETIYYMITTEDCSLSCGVTGSYLIGGCIEDCSNSIDDDGDGNVDCEDADCNCCSAPNVTIGDS